MLTSVCRVQPGGKTRLQALACRRDSQLRNVHMSPCARAYDRNVCVCVCVCSVMAARLQALAREGCCSDAAVWRAQAAHNLLQTTALARFLSYLGFAFTEGEPPLLHGYGPCTDHTSSFPTAVHLL